MKVTIEDLANRFSYHNSEEEKPEKFSTIRATALEFAALIVDKTPPSREQSLALTNLEQVVFWANAAIARNE